VRIMIDTNVFISALLRQGSVPDIVLNYVCQNHELVLCSQIISEIREVANRRFPKKAEVLDDLLAQLRYDLVPESSSSNFTQRDNSPLGLSPVPPRFD
jgi:predicted nucleic acid-binding protein